METRRNPHDPAAGTRNSMSPAGILILTVLAIVAALYLGSELLAPIALTIVLSSLLRPIVRWLQRIHVPTGVGAAIVVLSLLAAVGAAGVALAGPVRSWAAKAPETFAAAQSKLNRLRRPAQKLSSAASQLSGGLGSDTAQASQGASSRGAEQPRETPVKPAPPASAGGGDVPKVAARVAGTTTYFLGTAAGVLLLLYLILASGDMFRQKLVRVLPGSGDKQVAEDAVDQAEHVVLRYAWVNALVNLGQGIAVALVMWAIGMPSPWLWGVFTFVLEFIPYIGAAIMVVVLTLTAIASFDSAGRILLAPGSYLVISTLQNNLVSPLAYGKGLRLNPVAVFIGVLFWWYVWGVTGAFLAVPILAVMKIVADRTERFRPVGEFLGE